MAFDIKKINLAEQAEAGHEFEVKLPDGSSTDFFITVRGNLSPKMKKYSKDLFNKMQMKELQAKKRNKGEQPIDLDEAEATLIESAVARIVTWKGLEDDGKVVEPTQENIVRIMTELDWARTQVLEESDNAANFI
ncbi:MAG: hypothetical protein RSB94_07625 [Erysipelotrichaceae bacterium]